MPSKRETRRYCYWPSDGEAKARAAETEVRSTIQYLPKDQVKKTNMIRLIPLKFGVARSREKPKTSHMHYSNGWSAMP